MNIGSFIKYNKKDILKIATAVLLSLVAATLIFVFREKVLPEAEEQNAFDTVYAVENV